jgi:hypothetical protein
MLTLEVIKRGLPPNFDYTTEPMVLNPSSIVSISPAVHHSSLIREVNGRTINQNEICEIEYNVGERSEKVLVMGSYIEVLQNTRSKKRELLNG